MSTDAPPTPDLRTDDYDAMLDQLDRVTEDLLDKIENGRIRDPEREKVRVQQYRALGYLVRTKRKVLEDKTLDDLADEIEDLRDEV